MDAKAPVDVSVIVAVRNGAATLSQCVDSVLAQIGCSVELIVVDGMSTDATPGIVAAYGDRVAHSIREPDTGIYDAWNKALRVSTGEWCAFLGADDYFLDDRSVGTLLDAARHSDPVPVFVHGGVMRVGGTVEYAVHPWPQDLLAYLRSGKMLPHQGILHHVGALLDIGGFDPTFRVAGDHAAVLQLLENGRTQRCEAIVTAMALGGISNNWTTVGVAAKERFRILRREIGFWPALRFYVGHRAGQVMGRLFERTVIRLFGEQSGTKGILWLRLRLGRPPKLL